MDVADALADDSAAAIADLSKLYYKWLKNTIFNCQNSGFGPDPSDGFTDASGLSAFTPSNWRRSFKGRLTFRFAKLFNKYAGANTLTFV